MTPKRTLHAESTRVGVVIVTLDGHLGGVCERVAERLRQSLPGLDLQIHPASEWADDPAALARCHADIARADIIVATMLFMDAHIRAVLPALTARQPHCDAFVGAMSGAEVVRLTRMGKLRMDGTLKGPMALLKKLRGSKRPDRSSGAAQMKVLRRLPKILRYVPGTAQDLRTYFLALQCWLAGSDANVATLVKMLVARYAADERAVLANQLEIEEPIEYPETGLYHPRLPARVETRRTALPSTDARHGTVGLLLMRSYVLAGNTAHYDAVIDALEARGLRVIPAFASGLDARPAIDAFFGDTDGPRIDCLVSLTGFSLIGGPAYNDTAAAIETLTRLDVPYLSVHPSEFQTIEGWARGKDGLTPIEATMMVAIPELDGATSPILFAGHRAVEGTAGRNLSPIDERVVALADRVCARVALRRRERAERRLGVVLFNFPPNAGATGTAAYLSVFESLHALLHRLDAEGYEVEVPPTVDALREALLDGNRARYGTDANVLDIVPTDEHVRRQPWLEEIESHWGPAPGRQLANGEGVFILGARFGAVTVGIQPGFGIEGDPMRLLFEGGFAPTHAFAAFYRYLRETTRVDAILHFGTHGALEFMPGKQTGLSGDCWPERLIGDTPNFYLYAANNPSEGAIARRRSAATLVSYMTPAVTEAGLYRGLADLRASLRHWHALTDRHTEEGRELRHLIEEQCTTLELDIDVDWQEASRVDEAVATMARLLDEYEHTLVTDGLHVLGQAPSRDGRVDLLHAFQQTADGPTPDRETVAELVDALDAELDPTTLGERFDDPSAEADGRQAWSAVLAEMNRHLSGDAELTGLVHALDAGYVPPAPGGDILRNAETLPTGRNVHGFDPFRLPTPFAERAGRRHAELLIERHVADHGAPPSSVAFVLWGTDNLKSEGVPIAQVLALIGARARFDGFGKLCGAELIPLDTLGRARVDVLVTLSGIFRDLLPLQTRLLAEAALLAAEADEPLDLNPIRRNALDWQAEHGGDLRVAALRVFGNAKGAYGANVNQLIDSGAWTDENELAETYGNRKCFAYGVDGEPVKRTDLLKSALGKVDLAYQNLESVELGVTSLDYYFDTLGGINSMVRRARGAPVPVYIGDQTRGSGTVRSLQEQVALETRTRMLNPKWYEGMLKHGYEGVRCIEASVTNTLGWSATTGQVSPWVYRQLAETFVLDKTMRDRLADLNPAASARVAHRLLEAHERNYWTPDEDTLQALGDAGDELEDRIEGVVTGAAA